MKSLLAFWIGGAAGVIDSVATLVRLMRAITADVRELETISADVLEFEELDCSVRELDLIR